MDATIDQESEDVIAQARLISAALPYMLRYDQKVVVVKYGGHAMGDPALARAFARDITLLETSGVRPVVVHGGGPQIGEMLKRLGIESEFRGGLRVTDKKTIDVVEMVLAGSINKEIVDGDQRRGRQGGRPLRQGRQHGRRREADPHRDRSRFQHRAGGRSRLRRRAEDGQPHRASTWCSAPS